MATVFRVSIPFSRRHPVTGAMADYAKGDLVANPILLDDIMGTEHAAHGHMVNLPDDHHAVLPHLPDDHPAVQKYMADVQAGWIAKGRKEDEAVHAATARADKRRPDTQVEA